MDKNLPKSESLTAIQLLTNSFAEHQAAVQSVIGTKLTDIANSGEVICNALSSGKKILLCGNGGSAADAQHIAAELVVRY